MTPPLILDGFAPPVTYGATAGIYTARRVRTLDEARSTRLPIPTVCTCGPLECDFCWLRGDEAFERSQDL